MARRPVQFVAEENEADLRAAEKLAERRQGGSKEKGGWDARHGRESRVPPVLETV